MLRSPSGANGYAGRFAGYVRRTCTACVPCAGGSARTGGSGSGSAGLAGEGAHARAPRVPVVERGRVVPPLPEGVRQVADRRSAHLELHVVPGRAVAVARVELDRLRVAAVPVVVAPPVAEVDAADEGDVVVGAGRVAEEDQLLVMASAAPDPFVEQDLAAGLVDLAHEANVLLLGEVGLTRMGAPEEPADVHVPPGEVAEHVLRRLGPVR